MNTGGGGNDPIFWGRVFRIGLAIVVAIILFVAAVIAVALRAWS